MDKGDILPQIRRNVKLNRDTTISQCQTKVTVTELDFFKGVPKDDTDIRETDIIVVGDVIYDQVGDTRIHCRNVQCPLGDY